MKTGKPGRRQAIALLSLVLIFVLMCSSPEIQGNWKRTDPQPAQADSNEIRHEFMLPITLPEGQVFSGAFIAKTRFVPIQSRNKLIFSAFSSMLLLSCMVLWKYKVYKIVEYIHHLKPEMSLRIGGHAPPAAINI